MQKLSEVNKGWIVGRSILLELDAAVTFCCGGTVSGILPPDIAVLASSLPSQWRDEYINLMGELKSNSSLLEQMSLLSETQPEEDYHRASLPLRNLTAKDALSNLEKVTRNLDLYSDKKLPVLDQLADLKNRLNFYLYQSLGFHLASRELQVKDHFQELRSEFRVLQGEELHEQYWQWLDRFYYQVYAPWRLEKLQKMNSLENRVLTALGSASNTNSHPSLEWLSEKNALRSIPELKKAVQEDQYRVFFWIEPFGLHDNWLVEPNRITVACSEPGALVDNFFTFTTNLSERLQALSDPTRLLILRLIRNFGMTNTDMANYLGISRPTVSIHASILRKAGLIQSYPDGRIMRHEIVTAELDKLFADLGKFLDLPGKN